jgi:H+/Cl- antiporter ClcA
VPDAYAKNRSFWVRMGWGVLIGLLSALGTLAFVALMNKGIGLVWPEEPGPDPFSGPVRILVIMTIGGFIVGLIHRFLSARLMDEFEGAVKGRIDPRPVPGTLLVSLVSLISGFSVGPEVPTGLLAGGLATWISDKRKLDPETSRSNILSGITCAWGGLFTAPFGIIIMPFELEHKQTPGYYSTIFIAALTALIGFAIFYAFGRDSFASVLRILDLPVYSLKVWHLFLAIPLGLLGAILGLIFGFLLRSLTRLAMPLNRWPIIRGTAGGIILGLLGMALPLTLFLGTTGLKVVTDQSAQWSLAFLIVMVFAKMLVTAGAFSTGFIGGPIFPLLFVGGTAGTVVHLIFPGVPLGLAVGCLMAAVPGALLPVPLGLGVIVMLITGIPLTDVIPIFISALVAYFITHGFGLLKQG